MRSWYQVLGLPPEADEEEIKVAFRRLAKEFHPDLNSGAKDAERRFKEVRQAYEVLSDPHARARYDAALFEWRSLARQRWRNAAATMAVSFVLTAISVAVVTWRQHGEPPWLSSSDRQVSGLDAGEADGAVRSPPERAVSSEDKDAAAHSGGSVALETEVPVASTTIAANLSSVDGARLDQLSPTEREAPSENEGSTSHVRPHDLGSAVAPNMDGALHSGVGQVGSSRAGQLPQALSQAATLAPKPERGLSTTPPRQVVTAAASWATYRDGRFGFALSYPTDVFVANPAESDENVKSFLSRDGRATLRIFGTFNLAAMTAAQYRSVLIAERYANATFDYAPRRQTWFVVSGTLGDDTFYERVTFSCDGRSFHGWRLSFPTSERQIYEPIIEEMHRNYRHRNGPGARCVSVKSEAPPGATWSEVIKARM